MHIYSDFEGMGGGISGADSEMIGIAKRAYVNYAHALWEYGVYDDENIIKLEKNHTINGYYLNENYWRYPLPLSIISLSWKIVSTHKWQANDVACVSTST